MAMNKPPATPSRRSALDWPAETGSGEALLLELERRARRRRRRAVAGAGSLLAVIVVGLFFWRADFSAPAPAGPAVVLRPEQQRLPDGSTAELRDGARIRIAFSDRERRIELLAGEVHFAVMHDAARPFVVGTPGVEVRAVGTAFSVQRHAQSVEVLVTEGRVAVEAAAAAATPLPVLSAGDTVQIESAPDARPPAVVALAAEVVAERQAWRVPRLEFSSTPLAEAVALFNVHSPVRLTVADASLEHLRVSGLVRADNIGTLVRLLVTNYPVEAEPQGDGEIVLRRR